MAAPDDSKLRLCDKCFASVEPGSPFCGECGAALADGPDADGSDVAIYPELARANLLRMRGEYKQAEDVCLSLLRRYPNNATANTLLGDTCAERGDLVQAAEWYDLALDIVADSDAVRTKLAAVKLRLTEREAAATAKQIGLPDSTPRTGLVALIAILAIVAVGFAAYFFGRGALKAPTVMQQPIDVSTFDPRPDETPSDPAAPVPAGGTAWHDASFAAMLRQRLPESNRLLDAWQDPRSSAVILTVMGDAAASHQELVATMGVAVMEQLPAATLVTVRVVVGGSLNYVADIPRDKVIEISSDEWQRSNAPNSKAWIQAVVTNEWSSSPSTGDGL